MYSTRGPGSEADAGDRTGSLAHIGYDGAVPITADKSLPLLELYSLPNWVCKGTYSLQTPDGVIKHCTLKFADS